MLDLLIICGVFVLVWGLYMLMAMTAIWKSCHPELEDIDNPAADQDEEVSSDSEGEDVAAKESVSCPGIITNEDEAVVTSAEVFQGRGFKDD